MFFVTLVACGGGGAGDASTGPDTKAVTVEIKAPRPSLMVTEEMQLLAGGRTASGGAAACSSISWGQSDSKIALVDLNGLIHGYKPGTVTVTATCSIIRDRVVQSSAQGTLTIPVVLPASPFVNGYYTLGGTFDNRPGSTLRGTVRFDQKAGQFGTITGDASYTATVNGVTYKLDGLYAASITPAGELRFSIGGVLGGGNVIPGVPYLGFVGTLSGDQVAGRHTLSDNFFSYGGSSTLTPTP